MPSRTEHPLVTVFTATFNRAHTLPRVYKSLIAQTYRPFEWLIIDDGSFDSTFQLVEAWQLANVIPIRYYRQPNSGKHVAFNRGVTLARGTFLVSLDSDDEATPNALSTFMNAWFGIHEAARGQYSGVVGRCRDDKGRVVGGEYVRSPLDCLGVIQKYRYPNPGDKLHMTRIEVLREFPLPEIANAKFVPEGMMYSAMGRRYKRRFINDVLLVYWTQNSAGAQLTKNFVPEHQALALSIWHRDILNEDLGWFWHRPSKMLASAIHYARFSMHSGVPVIDQCTGLRAIGARFLWLAAVAPACALYARDRSRRQLVSMSKWWRAERERLHSRK